jgi:hypothetical protein
MKEERRLAWSGEGRLSHVVKNMRSASLHPNLAVESRIIEGSSSSGQKNWQPASDRPSSIHRKKTSATLRRKWGVRPVTRFKIHCQYPHADPENKS